MIFGTLAIQQAVADKQRSWDSETTESYRFSESASSEKN
jgi:hypothetical protein